MKKPLRIVSTVTLALFSSSCGNSLFTPIDPQVIDPAKKLERSDYQQMTSPDAGTENDPRVSFNTASDAPPIPDLAPILATPQPPKIGQTKLVSIAVTDDVPLKDVLLELSRLADVDIEIDASITGGISFRAKDKPFNEVIERIADLAGLRYSMKAGVLRVERDSPYVQMYPIDFLNLDRSTTSSVNISTNVLSSGGGASGSGSGSGSSSSSSGGGASGGGGLNTGSTSSISAKNDSDFWKQFEEGVKQILTFAPATRTSVATAPAATSTDGTATAAGAASASNDNKPFYILNRQAATLTVSATEKQHRLIKEFIRRIQSNASAQVLIEAKIVEVTLADKFESGIDWSKLGTNNINFTSKFGGVTDNTNIATFSINKQNVIGGVDLSTAVRLAENFGTTRTLSSPRLHAINNQQAVLTFAQNEVYFELSIDRQQTATTSTTTTTTVESTIRTVPIGIIMTMMPSINSETNEITLNIRPTLSRVTGFRTDPAVAYLISTISPPPNISNQVPVVEVRELDSILKLRSGQVMVIGGLMEDKSTNDDRGIPGVQDVPIFGNLFKGVKRDNNTKELVIFIRATIVDSSGNAQDADKTLYKKFTTDPRPLTF